MHRTAIVTLVAVGALALAATPGFAAKGGGKGGSSGSSLSLLLQEGDTEVNHGDRISFAVSTTATDRPFVGIRCWQGERWVYDRYIGFFPGATSDPWPILDSSNWTAGVAASCTARLFSYTKRGTETLYATLHFTALP